MSALEKSAFFTERAMKNSAILGMPEVRSTPMLLELNMRQVAQNHLMSALIDWRHRLTNPRPKLTLAFNACASALEVLPILDSPTPLHSRFRFYDIVFLAKLLDIDVPIKCVPVLKECRSNAEVDSCLDFALAETLLGFNVLGPIVETAAFTNRQNLLKTTYSTYLDLLNGIFDAIELAEENFTERRKNSYYSGGLQIDGGGLNNSDVIDYRLACVLKTSGVKTDSIHELR